MTGEQQCLTEPERSAIIEYFELEPSEQWTHNERGMVNDTFELSDDYFVTIYRGRSKAFVETLGAVAMGVPEDVPIVRPLHGRSGYALSLITGPASVSRRLPGVHYVGLEHTDKQPIPKYLHPRLATLFWKLQSGLSATPDRLKQHLALPSRATIGQIPDVIPPAGQRLKRFTPDSWIPACTHPDLIHDDLERQNILSEGKDITGVVDLDSIRQGDILYEFGHFMFNIVFCDTRSDFATADLYINKMVDAGVIALPELPMLYGHMYHFAISDISDFADLLQHTPTEQKRVVDLDLLASQYEQALNFAAAYFDQNVDQ